MWSLSCVVLLAVTVKLEAYVSVARIRNHRISRTLHVATENAADIEKEVLFGVESWRAGYQTCKKETVEALGGDIPADLEGTYYRNGFGKFESGRVKILHPFDADGMIAAVTMKEGKVTYRNSFIRTRAFTKESKTRQMAARGTFGNHKMPGFLGNFLSLKLKNVANTNVIYWGGRLLALWEGGLPYKLDPKTLRTDSKEYTMRGLLKKGDRLTAHPRVDSERDRLVAFSVKQDDMKMATVRVVEFDNTLTSIAERSFDLPGFSFFHDFVITKNYYIFNNPPLDFDPMPFVLGQKAPAECIKYREGAPSILYIVPRNPALPAQTLEVPGHFNFHFANGFEEDGKIVFDMVHGADMQLGTELSDKEGKVPIWEILDREAWKEHGTYYTLQRFTLTPSVGKNELGQPASWTSEMKQLSKKNIDFTSVNPKVAGRKHRYIFSNYARDSVLASPPQGIVKLDVEAGTESSWIGGADEYLGEPLFAKKKDSSPTADEDDGYILSFLNNWKEGVSDFVVFDAKNIAKGPIYKSRLSVALPPGLHGTYVDGLTFEQDDIIQKWRSTNALDRQTWNEVNSGFSGLGISYDL